MTTTTYTSGLRLTNQPDGGNASTWGEIADNNFEFIDDAITRVQEIDMTGATSHTLTIANGSDDESRSAVLEIVGTPASANSIIIPDSEKIYAVHAQHTSVAGGITVRTNSGTGVTYLTGNKGFVYCDGVSVYDLNPPVSALDPSKNLSDVADTSATLVNLGLGGFTSVSSFDSGNFEVSNGVLGINVSSLLEVIYPVGSIYSNRTDSTNPGTLMSFGTWASAGVGRVLIGVGIGIDETGTSAVVTAETCGGDYGNVLTCAQFNHTHETGAPQRTSQYNNRQIIDSAWPYGHGTTSYTAYNQGFGGFDNSSSKSRLAGPPIDVSGSVTKDSISTLQPWYSVYHWVRTA